jgi:hypothetical protein
MEFINMRLDDVQYLMEQVLSIKDDLEGRDESETSLEPVAPATELPAAAGNAEEGEAVGLEEVAQGEAGNGSDDDDDEQTEDWDEEDEDNEEDLDEPEEYDEEDEEHPAAKFFDLCLDIDLVRSTEGRLIGAILTRTTGGPHIEVFTRQRLIVGSWAGCPPVAVNYCDRIGLEDYILECFPDEDR